MREKEKEGLKIKGERNRIYTHGQHFLLSAHIGHGAVMGKEDNSGYCIPPPRGGLIASHGLTCILARVCCILKGFYGDPALITAFGTAILTNVYCLLIHMVAEKL